MVDQIRNKIWMVQFSTNRTYNNPFGKDLTIPGNYHILLSSAIEISQSQGSRLGSADWWRGATNSEQLSRQSDFRAQPLNHKTQLSPSGPHHFIAQIFGTQEWTVASDYMPSKFSSNYTYPDRWVASTGYWRTSHNLGPDQVMAETEGTAPPDSHTLRGCQGKATGPCAPAGGSSQEQSCQTLLSTWSERTIK